jgi:hypothetical protein
MNRPSKRVVGILCSALSMALVALWPSPAQAGQSGHRLRPAGGHHQRLQKHDKQKSGARAAQAPVRSAPATPR